jgi:hypothetical protein
MHTPTTMLLTLFFRLAVSVLMMSSAPTGAQENNFYGNWKLVNFQFSGGQSYSEKLGRGWKVKEADAIVDASIYFSGYELASQGFCASVLYDEGKNNGRLPWLICSATQRGSTVEIRAEYTHAETENYDQRDCKIVIKLSPISPDNRTTLVGPILYTCTGRGYSSSWSGTVQYERT